MTSPPCCGPRNFWRRRGGDHDDADALRHDPAFRLATKSSAGLTPLVSEPGLASQPTLSRFTALMAEPGDLIALRDGVLERVARALPAQIDGRRPPDHARCRQPAARGPRPTAEGRRERTLQRAHLQGRTAP